MGIIGSAIGAVGNIASSIIGGISAAKAMKNVKHNIEEQRQKNEDWYNRRYNEDATQRADAQRLLTMTEDFIKQRNKAVAGNAAVMGGTEESVAAAKAANNQVLANATSQIAARAEARKDDIEASYLHNDNVFNEELNNVERNKANSIAQAVKGAAETNADIANTLPW